MHIKRAAEEIVPSLMKKRLNLRNVMIRIYGKAFFQKIPYFQLYLATNCNVFLHKCLELAKKVVPMKKSMAIDLLTIEIINRCRHRSSQFKVRDRVWHF